MDKLQIASKQILAAYPDVIAIYCFGSFGTEYETPASDLDLAILSAKKIGTLKLWELAQSIARKISQEVDLIDLNQVSTILRHQVVYEGKRIYCSNKLKCDLFENSLDREYFDLQDLCAGILEDIKQRGSIYG
jgi:predicted nucleotidyltransferase